MFRYSKTKTLGRILVVTLALSPHIQRAPQGLFWALICSILNIIEFMKLSPVHGDIITWKGLYPNSSFSLLLVQKALLCSAQSSCITYYVDEKNSFPENKFFCHITLHQVNKSWTEILGEKYFEARFFFSSNMFKLVTLTMYVTISLPLFMLDFISNWFFLIIYFWGTKGKNTFSFFPPLFLILSIFHYFSIVLPFSLFSKAAQNRLIQKTVFYT